jgi:pimeloyl-ACP methyl ester carboxylesterase
MKEQLLLLHGALGTKDQFSDLEKKWIDRFDIHAINFEGHGGDLISGSYSIDRFANQVLTYMNTAALESAHIFGYSMGGYVGLKLAYDHPDRVKKIITFGTKFKWDPESAAKDVRMMNPDIIEQKVLAFAASLQDRHAPEDWKKVMRATADMMTAMGEDGAFNANDWESIQNQVLVCIGSADHMVSIEESEFVANQLPHGRICVLEGFKHPLESVDVDHLSLVCSQFLL